MNPAQFNQVTVIKKANIYFDGKCISHTIQFDDGSKKTVGVILPTEKPLMCETHVPERMGIIAGGSRVKIAEQAESELCRAGQSFYVSGSIRFSVETVEPSDYVCHLEG